MENVPNVRSLLESGSLIDYGECQQVGHRHGRRKIRNLKTRRLMYRHIDRHVGMGTAGIDRSIACPSPERNHRGRSTKQPSKETQGGLKLALRVKALGVNI